MINQYSDINLDSAVYKQVDLNSKNSFYLIAITEDKSISSISFSVAIDSGVKDRPFKIAVINVAISDEISGSRFCNYPETFYLKPIQVIKTDGSVHTSGQFDVAININPMKLD